MFLDTIMSSPGPDVPDLHYDEMSIEDIRNLNAYLHSAIKNAFKYDEDGKMTEVLIEWYDELFTAHARASRGFRQRFLDGLVRPPGGASTREKYLAIVMEASES